MSDEADRASEREATAREDALREQARRAGLAGKTAADSAARCGQCDARIPMARRRAAPGCQLCVACQERLEKRRGLK